MQCDNIQEQEILKELGSNTCIHESMKHLVHSRVQGEVRRGNANEPEWYAIQTLMRINN